MTGQLRWRTIEVNPEHGSWSTLRDEAWWEEPIGSDWIAAIRLGASAGRVVATEFRIFPDLRKADSEAGEWTIHATDFPSEGLPDKARRDVSVGKMLGRARQAMAAEYEAEPSDSKEFLLRFGDYSYMETPLLRGGYTDLPSLTKTAPSERTGPKGHGLDWHLRVAWAYAKNVEAGSETPTKDMRHELKLEVDAGDAVSRCRIKYGLLTKVPQGRRSGGRLTPRAVERIKELGWDKKK